MAGGAKRYVGQAASGPGVSSKIHGLAGWLTYCFTDPLSPPCTHPTHRTASTTFHSTTIMKTVACLSVAGLLGAQAFVAPAPKFGRTRGVAKMSFENEAGVTAPLGYWVRAVLRCAVLCCAGRVCCGDVRLCAGAAWMRGFIRTDRRPMVHPAPWTQTGPTSGPSVGPILIPTITSHHTPHHRTRSASRLTATWRSSTATAPSRSSTAAVRPGAWSID